MLVVSFKEICGGHVSAAGGANFAFDVLGLALGLVDGLDLRKKKGRKQKQSFRSGILFKEDLPALAELLHQQLSNHPQLYVTEANEVIWFRVKKSL
jgi:hypothetical protein